MEAFDQQLMHEFSVRQAELSDRVVMRYLRNRPPGESAQWHGGFSGCMRDASAHIASLANAVAADEPALFLDYAVWAQQCLARRNADPDRLARLLETTIHCVSDVLSDSAAPRAVRCLEQAVACIRSTDPPVSMIDAQGPFAAVCRTYLDALVGGDYAAAESCIAQAAADGASLTDILMEVLQPCQWELGRLWQMNEIGVAAEHYCTACARSIMDRIVPRASGARDRNCAVAACVMDELHDLGLQMVCHLLEMSGWRTYYVGASLPAQELLPTLSEQRPALFAVSVTLARHVRWAAALVQLVRSCEQTRDIKIMVGGRPFQLAPHLWRKVGADATAVDARSAAAEAELLTQAASA